MGLCLLGSVPQVVILDDLLNPIESLLILPYFLFRGQHANLYSCSSGVPVSTLANRCIVGLLVS